MEIRLWSQLSLSPSGNSSPFIQPVCFLLPTHNLSQSSLCQSGGRDYILEQFTIFFKRKVGLYLVFWGKFHFSVPVIPPFLRSYLSSATSRPTWGHIVKGLCSSPKIKIITITIIIIAILVNLWPFKQEIFLIVWLVEMFLTGAMIPCRPPPCKLCCRTCCRNPRISTPVHKYELVASDDRSASLSCNKQVYCFHASILPLRALCCILVGCRLTETVLDAKGGHDFCMFCITMGICYWLVGPAYFRILTDSAT